MVTNGILCLLRLCSTSSWKHFLRAQVKMSIQYTKSLTFHIKVLVGNLNFEKIILTLSLNRSAIRVSIIFPPFSLSNNRNRGKYLSTIKNPESLGHITVFRVMKLAISPMYFLGSTAGQDIFFKLLANKQVSWEQPRLVLTRVLFV